MHRIAAAQPFHNSYLFRCIGQPSRCQLFWPGNIYVPTGMEDLPTDVTKIGNIVADQLVKFVKGQSSIFSPGFWPFGTNLLFKHLSYEEIKMIARNISVKGYTHSWSVILHHLIDITSARNKWHVFLDDLHDAEIWRKLYHRNQHCYLVRNERLWKYFWLYYGFTWISHFIWLIQ